MGNKFGTDILLQAPRPKATAAFLTVMSDEYE